MWWGPSWFWFWSIACCVTCSRRKFRRRVNAWCIPTSSATSIRINNVHAHWTRHVAVWWGDVAYCWVPGPQCIIANCYNTQTSTLWIPDTLDRHAYFYLLTHHSMVDSYGLTNSFTLCPIIVITLCPSYYMRSTLCPVTILAMPFALARHVYKLMYL